MNALKRRLKIVAALLLGFLLLCYAAIHFIVRSETFRTRIQSELSERTGYDVRIESLRLTPRLSLVASGPVVSKNGEVLFQGKRIVCFFLPFDYFFGRIHRLSLEKPLLHLTLQDLFSSSGKTSPNLSIGTLNIDDGEFVLKTGHGEPFALRAISLNAKNLNLGGQTGLQLRAYLPALNGNAVFSFSGGSEEKRAGIVIHQAEENSPARLLPKVGDGKKVFDARFEMRAKEKDAYQLTGSGEIQELRWGSETINGQFNSVFEIGAKLETLHWSVDFKTPEFPMKIFPMAITLQSGPVSATLAGDYSAARKTVKLEKISAASGLGTLEGQGAVALAENPARLTMMLRLRDVALDALKPLMPGALSELSYTGKIAADVNVSGPYSDAVIAGSAWNDGGRVEGEKVSLRRLSFKVPFQWAGASLRAKAGRFQAEDLLLGRKGETQFKVQQASLVGDIVKERQKPIQVSADFQLLGGRFSTPDESKIGEHLNAKGRFTCQDCGGDASFKSEARIESLQLLWNKFFGDFKDRKPSIKVAGSYHRAADELRFNELAVSLDSIGHLDLRGSVRRLLVDPLFALEIQSDDLRPAGFYDFFVRDTFKAAYPTVGQIELAGKSGIAIRAQGSRESFTVEGKLRLEQAVIQERAGRWRVGPVALDLPLRLSFPEAPKEKTGEAPTAGYLSIDEIKSTSTTIPKISAPLVLWNNALRFPEPIRLSLFGGSGLIEGLAWKDVVGAPADLSFSLELKDLRLIELTETLGWHRFDGALSGSIPEVHWARDSLKSDGAITLSVFGGRVTVRGMEIEKPLSALRSIKMSVRLDALDLEQTSQTFEFGRISGALSGTIENLVMSQGQPAEFRADIQTVEKPGISRWISVEALDKITVLSSGNEAGSIYGGLAGLFDSFRYSKLGFKAALKNDTLTLRGIESRNGQEYLVVGTLLPPTVNIISHTQEIGFSELLRRLERVKKNSTAK